MLFVAAGPMLGKMNDRLSQGGFEVPGSESDRVKQAIENDFKSRFTLTDVLVVHSDTLRATDPAFRGQVASLRLGLSKGPGVAAVIDPYAQAARFISPDGHTVTAVVGLNETQDSALRHVPDLDAIVKDTSKGFPGTAQLTGAAPFYKAFQETTGGDLEKAERIALPIALVILLLAFGTVVAAGMPIILALMALTVSFGLVTFIAGYTLVSFFAQNLMSMIGLGVGIDYALFILTRYREGLHKGAPIPIAIASAMATSGKAVLVSALTVIVALSGTLLVNIAAFKSMGFAAMIAVFFACAAAMTLLPALLSLLGHRIDSLRVRRMRDGVSGLWHRWATGVMRRPWLALSASVIVLGALALPVRNLRLGSSGSSILPADATPRVAAEIVGAAFGEGQVGPTEVLATEPSGVLGAGFERVFQLSRALAQDPEVVRVDSIADIVPGAPLEVARQAATSPQAAPYVSTVLAGDKTLLTVVTKHAAQSDEVGEFVRRARAMNIGSAHIVGGDSGLNVDINDEVGGKLIPVVGLVMALSFLVLMLFFRSILLPLKAIAMNALAVMATYGAMVYVFQEGHFTKLLDFEATGHIESFLPLFLFTTLFGLSMDYEVFLLARVREEYRRTGDNTEAVGWGLEHTAGIITSAAAIMVVVFGAFMFTSLVPIKEMGFGLAAAVFLDASIIRVVLVPATMRLMGKWNWWLPSWMDRVLPNVSLESADEESLETMPA